MFTIICMFFFLGFMLWMNTSKRISWPDKNKTLTYLATYSTESKYAVTVLFVLATVLSILKMGWGSGIMAAIVILMTVGSMSVLFFPFKYLNLKGIATIFFLSFILEILFT